jgi:transposase, IS30 family
MPKLLRKRYNSHNSRGILFGKRHISERIDEVDTRDVFGHWEGNPVIGRDRHHRILTFVERKSRLVIIKKSESRLAAAVIWIGFEAIRDYLKYVIPIPSTMAQNFMTTKS